ncbi:hypothetical protein GC175_12490 [bacterium]|nr:hypothetical protein [bacterium]
MVDFEVLLHRLKEHDVEFIIVGGAAAVVHGSSRMTQDLDSVMTLQRGLNFTLSTVIGPVDLFGEVAGGGNYEDPLPHTVVIDVFGVSCRCLNLNALIRTKRAAGRPKDLSVIAELEAIQEEQQDGSSDSQA